MIVTGSIRKGAYFDSITLMRSGKEIATLKGIVDAAVVMGTKSNKAILSSSGLAVPLFDDAGEADLLIVVKARSREAAAAALAAADALFKGAGKKTGPAGERHPVSLEGALEIFPEANLALISVAGRYAGKEAIKAIEHGLHVMLFSDNVPLEEEIALKTLARKKGLLAMGPDCGTAIINGLPLGFANVVNRGNIGIVAAAGTGLQEASCILSNAGAGISQAIGTGGRDVKKAVGGIMFVEALKALGNDESTRVILLIAKPPDRDVMNRITRETRRIRKPVVPLFIGAETRGEQPSTLEQAALMAVALSRGDDPGEVAGRLAARDEEVRQMAMREGAKRKQGQKYLRGLFSGGTFCAEAQILFSRMIANVFSNAPAGAARQLENSLSSRENTVVDLGEDEFTVGRLHPMIDYSLRKQRFRQEAHDPETAVILLDIVLGYGSNPDPASELSEVIREGAKKVTVVCSVTGTDQDPQIRSSVKKRLEEAGAIVMPTNAAACIFAGTIAQVRGSK
jgi:succinyl-CoA synthetase alpha subunit